MEIKTYVAGPFMTNTYLIIMIKKELLLTLQLVLKNI